MRLIFIQVTNRYTHEKEYVNVSTIERIVEGKDCCTIIFGSGIEQRVEESVNKMLGDIYGKMTPIL